MNIVLCSEHSGKTVFADGTMFVDGVLTLVVILRNESHNFPIKSPTQRF